MLLLCYNNFKGVLHLNKATIQLKFQCTKNKYLEIIEREEAWYYSTIAI